MGFRISGRAGASVSEPLERRMLLSTFTWTNRGSDSFATRYGANAELARTIVDRALLDWGRMIVNFNRMSGNNNFNLTVNATVFSGTTRGSTGGITTDAQGKPLSAGISLDDNGGGAGWFFDPTPGTVTLPDDSEFDQFVNPFMARSSTQGGADLYRTIAHEVCHAVGILIGGSPAINQFLTNTGVTDPVDGTGTLYAFNVGGGPIEATLTTTGGGHLFEGPAVPGHPELPFHPGDLINSGRSVVPPPSVRELISATDIMVLQLAYGYSVLQPSQVNTFYANFNTTTGALVVQGAAGASADSLSMDLTGSNMRAQVNGSSEVFPIASVNSITLNGGDGSDTININETAAGKPVTILPSNGNDGLNINADAVGSAEAILNATHRFGSLSVSAGGRLDVRDNLLIIDYTGASPIASIQSSLASGYNNGLWSGSGIETSLGDSSQFALGFAEATDLFSVFPATFAGQSIDDTSILIRYTRYGDANLDRTVNLADFNIVAANFGQAPRRFSQGDFNFDTNVNLNDFNLLAGNFGESLLPAFARPADARRNDRIIDTMVG